MATMGRNRSLPFPYCLILFYIIAHHLLYLEPVVQEP